MAGISVRSFAAFLSRRRPLAEDYGSLALAWVARRGNFVTKTHAGGRSLEGARQVAVFVHYDRRGEVHDYVVFYLLALRSAGFEIIFVSNGNGLTQRSLDRILPLCVGVLRRRNVGYDFGAYRDGLRYLGDLGRFQQVLLANDSVYGPFFDLRGLLERCDDSAAIWGMTDSWGGRYHLQSYFLLLRRPALVSVRFARFWQSVQLLQSKRAVIRFYEIGFTQAMLREGIRCAALFPYRVAAQDLARAGNAGVLTGKAMNPRMSKFYQEIFVGVEEGRPFNPLHFFWDHMIGEMRCPFIKRELLTTNPARIPHAYLWERLIRSVSTYDTTMITIHLQLTNRTHAP